MKKRGGAAGLVPGLDYGPKLDPLNIGPDHGHWLKAASHTYGGHKIYQESCQAPGTDQAG